MALDYIETARDLGANEIALDQIGIEVTRVNARLLITALRDSVDVVSAPPVDYESAGHAVRSGEVPVMGGVAPAQTTDAVSAALAEYVDADLLVYATSVPGVFSADPNVDPDAEHYERLFSDLIAAKVIHRAGIRAVVLDGTDPGRIRRAVDGEAVRSTEVVPADDEEGG